MPGSSLRGPDAIVDQLGEAVTHEFVADWALDDNGQVDPDSLELEERDRQAVVAEPTEEDEQRVDARLGTGSYRLTVSSDVDVAGDRGGRRDRFRVRDQWTEVVEVRADRNPLTGTEKQTVLVDRLDGHRPTDTTE